MVKFCPKFTCYQIILGFSFHVTLPDESNYQSPYLELEVLAYHFKLELWFTNDQADQWNGQDTQKKLEIDHQLLTDKTTV
jgi:hypothetical protein